MVVQFNFVLLVIKAILFAGSACSPENLKKLAEANNELALNLYHQLASPSENLFFSPFSLSTAFGMVYYGAKGETAKELRQTLGYEAAGLPEEFVHPTFQHYLNQILPTQDPSAYALSSANAALKDRKFDLLSSYEKAIQDYYQAMIKEVDFEAENQEVVREINEWTKNKTNGMIKHVLDELNPSTVLFLINAVYFKGTWKTEFDTSQTKQRNFYNRGLLSDVKKVPMMKLKAKLPYTTDDELKVEAIEMLYKGENISMIVLLPHEKDGLEVLQEKLTLEKFKNIRSALYRTRLFLSFPKFKLDYSKEMATSFEALGLKSVFSGDADLSGMTESEGIRVSQVLHKAVLDVNEEGSEAAAVTGIIIMPISAIRHSPPNVIVDHPFLFAIVDKRNDMILFVGQVTNL